MWGTEDAAVPASTPAAFPTGWSTTAGRAWRPIEGAFQIERLGIAQQLGEGFIDRGCDARPVQDRQVLGAAFDGTVIGAADAVVVGKRFLGEFKALAVAADDEP